MQIASPAEIRRRRILFITLLWIITGFGIAAITMAAAHAKPSHYIANNDGRMEYNPPVEQRRHIRTKRHSSRHHKRSVDGNGNRARRVRVPHWVDPTGKMVQVETVQGFKLTVHPAYASKFLKFFALLKEHGFEPPKDMVGCYSRAHKRGSNHAIGAACDIQTGWNRTVGFMYRAAEPLIRQAGLFSGCAFGDCGHVEAVRGLFNHAPNLYASLAKFHAEQDAAKAADNFELLAEAVNTQGQPKEIKTVSAKRKPRVASARHHSHRRYYRMAHMQTQGVYYYGYR